MLQASLERSCYTYSGGGRWGLEGLNPLPPPLNFQMRGAELLKITLCDIMSQCIMYCCGFKLAALYHIVEGVICAYVISERF